ncbi:MAG: hypothetical protein JSS02_10270 [Planctomycetes bacterium]|nr:hypothetical protein [Planctomycetota bacterium]
MLGRIVKATTGRTTGTRVTCQPGIIRVTAPDLFSSASDGWSKFLARVLTLRDVTSVEIDRHSGCARIAHEVPSERLSGFLERLAQAMQGSPIETDSPVPALLATDELLPSLASASRFRLSRRENRLSTWELIHSLPGRVRVRDWRLVGDSQFAGRLVTSLQHCAGVRKATASTLTGSVVIHFDRHALDGRRLLAFLDHWDQPTGLAVPVKTATRSEWLAAHATLGLAISGTLFYAPLLPVSAAILVFTNLRTIRQAGRDLLRGHVGLPLLQTAIVTATLATGGFVAASLMNWLLMYWEERQSRLAATGHQMLQHSVVPPTMTAWVLRDGVDVETPVSRLEPGAVIRVRVGDWIPIDGWIVDGQGVLAESPSRGTTNLICRGVGDKVFTGSFLLEGELQVETSHAGRETLSGAIVRSLAGTVQGAGDVHGKRGKPPRFAERAVPATLLTAGLGLIVADPTAAGAVLRPDYATGLGLGNSTGFIDCLGTCLDQGVVIRRPDAFTEIGAADVVLIDEQVILDSPELQLEDIHANSDLTTGELLNYAECAIRPFHDPRGQALRAACDLRDRELLNLAGRYVGGAVELQHRGRRIRVEGLLRTQGLDDDDQELMQGHWPLRVLCDGSFAGTLTFCASPDSRVATALQDLRLKGGLRVELLASASNRDPDELADRYAVDDVRICPADASKARLIELLRDEGHTVLYIGNCRQNPLAAQAANLAIFPEPTRLWEPAGYAAAEAGDDDSGIWLLQADYRRILMLREMARSLERQSRLNCGLILAPNVLCVAGAFLFGFTSLTVVLLSNLATFIMFLRSQQSMQQAQARIRERHNRRIGQSMDSAVREAVRTIEMPSTLPAVVPQPATQSASPSAIPAPAPAVVEPVPAWSAVPPQPAQPAFMESVQTSPEANANPPLESASVDETMGAVAAALLTANI